MPAPIDTLELLVPARTAEIGIEAVNHGADAVYIGGPGFGARHGAGNDVADIARLAQYAHRFHARVFAALNTILTDAELEPARRLAWALYEAGVDALIVQDMGLLALDLPPIALHASTQTDNRSVDKVRFLQRVGFSQIVLARELSLSQIRQIADASDAVLEYFVHGALCVSYSGQCYISHAQTGRSANRGECSQACRLPYDLTDAEGRVVAAGSHLLSMKDNDQSANLLSLAQAGIRSFKIEGRLKDIGYVKNVTAHYRRLLDELIEAGHGFRAASSGRTSHAFTPRPQKSFNRGATDYFVHGRQPEIGAFESPGYIGEPVGHVAHIDADSLQVEGEVDFSNGDGLCFRAADGQLQGMRINRAVGRRLWPAEMPAGLGVGTALFRNHDQAFERALEKPSAERRIAVDFRLEWQPQGLTLHASDAEGHCADTHVEAELEPARDPLRGRETIIRQLSRSGETHYAIGRIDGPWQAPPFVAASMLNALRRAALDALSEAREAARPRTMRRPPAEPPALYPERELGYLGNVLNGKAREFYRRHGVELIADAYECNRETGDVSLMVTRHCLRYSFNLCPKEVRGIRPEPMQLVHGKQTLTLTFDCKRCEMHVVGRLDPAAFPRAAQPVALPRTAAAKQTREAGR